MPELMMKLPAFRHIAPPCFSHSILPAGHFAMPRRHFISLLASWPLMPPLSFRLIFRLFSMRFHAIS